MESICTTQKHGPRSLGKSSSPASTSRMEGLASSQGGRPVERNHSRLALSICEEQDDDDVRCLSSSGQKGTPKEEESTNSTSTSFTPAHHIADISERFFQITSEAECPIRAHGSTKESQAEGEVIGKDSVRSAQSRTPRRHLGRLESALEREKMGRETRLRAKRTRRRSKRESIGTPRIPRLPTTSPTSHEDPPNRQQDQTLSMVQVAGRRTQGCQGEESTKPSQAFLPCAQQVSQSARRYDFFGRPGRTPMEGRYKDNSPQGAPAQSAPVPCHTIISHLFTLRRRGREEEMTKTSCDSEPFIKRLTEAVAQRPKFSAERTMSVLWAAPAASHHPRR